MRRAVINLARRREVGQHPGLLLQRFLSEPATGERGNPDEKRLLLSAAIAASGNEELRRLYKGAFERWAKTLPTDPAHVDLTTAGRLIVGLGSENVLETGIRLHHTYGLPVIPGSALKGLAAHYCHQVWGRGEGRFLRGADYHRLLFGTTDDSGCATFHDAWLVPGSTSPLLLDVMTPHHPEWLDGAKPPTDFDSPVPVAFMSAAGTFRVAVSWNGPPSDRSKNWTALARTLLQEALKEWGVGGKTSSGYGRLINPNDAPTPMTGTATAAVAQQPAL